MEDLDPGDVRDILIRGAHIEDAGGDMVTVDPAPDSGWVMPFDLHLADNITISHPAMTVESATALAEQHHAGQVDKGGAPYIEHVLAVRDALEPYGPDAQMAGVLHDIVEDTPVTLDELAALGAPPNVVAAVDAVTRREGEPYMDLIARAAAHPLGRIVKLADNRHNSIPARLALLDWDDEVRLTEKYRKARGVLVQAFLNDAVEDVLQVRPYHPTEDAYQAAHNAVEKHRVRADTAEDELRVAQRALKAVTVLPAIEPDPAGAPHDCTAGQGNYPHWCDRHPEHFWCRVCDGFYGVPHDGHHGPDSLHGRDRHLAEQCACRPCVRLLTVGTAPLALNQGALDAAVRAITAHPSTTFMAPVEELALVALTAADRVLCGLPLDTGTDDTADRLSRELVDARANTMGLIGMVQSVLDRARQRNEELLDQRDRMENPARRGECEWSAHEVRTIAEALEGVLAATDPVSPAAPGDEDHQGDPR